MATFCYKFKQNLDEIALINMRCKHRRLSDSIYELNSDRPTSSCQYSRIEIVDPRISLF